MSVSSSNAGGRSRIAPLDGFRALAVVMVVAFHYLADLAMQPEMTHLYPFGDAYVALPLVRFGNLGVQLFFIVSGFVIAMTLEVSRTPAEFALKRFARLFPSMLLCTLLTFAALTWLPHPTWRVTAIDLLPGLTFVSEHVWSVWLDRPVSIVDGVYWTLFVEMKFYVLAAALFFVVRKAPLLFSLGALLNLVFLITRLKFVGLPEGWIEIVKTSTVYDQLPLFVAGVAFYSLNARRHRFVAWWLLAESAVMLLMRLKFEAEPALFLGVFYLMFIGLVYAPQTVAVFAWRPLVAIGASSYALYLLHNRLGISLTYNLGFAAPGWLRHSPVLPVGVGVAIALISIAVHRVWELPSRRVIVDRGLRIFGSRRSAVSS